ncbi:MAG: PAS domain S-box protein [Planctomycetaceae bacterium]|nr:PAS domain S-box protein [Planctomycetaceae bacterium]
MKRGSDQATGIHWANQRLAQGKSTPGGFAEEIPFGVWMTDAEGGLRYASEKFLELLNMTMEEAKGSGWTDRIASDDKHSFQRWKNCVANQNDWQDEHQIRDRDGNTRTLLAHGLPVREDLGRISCWIGVHIDITERKKAEELVREARDFAQGIVETVREPLITLDAELHVLTANRSFYHTFHTTPEMTEGRYIYDLGDGQWDIPHLRQLFSEVLNDDHAFEDYEVEHDFPNIGRKVMLLNARRLRLRNGNHEIILLAIEDITERKQVEERLSIIRMTQGEQRERERMAERLHDHVQQLLVAANMHVAALSRNAEQLSELRDIRAILDDAIEVTRNLAVETNPPVLLDSGMIAALHWLKGWMYKHYALDVEVKADPETRFDEPEMCILVFEAVRELLFNVVKYADVNEAIVRANALEEGGLQILVSDEGVGFDPHHHKKESDLAAGYGLAKVRQKIEAVGGSLLIESSPSHGTDITITIPLRQSE